MIDKQLKEVMESHEKIIDACPAGYRMVYILIPEGIGRPTSGMNVSGAEACLAVIEWLEAAQRAELYKQTGGCGCEK